MTQEEKKEVKKSMTKNKLFVSNLPSSMSGFSLKALFTRFGKIIDVAIISESSTGRSKRFGFITFASFSDSKKATTAMNNTDIEGLNLLVKIVDQEEETNLIKFHHEKLSAYA